MFDLIMRSAQALQQVGMYFAAMVCFGLGALLVGNTLNWRTRAGRVIGTIIGVVKKDGMYAPVYRYATADGVWHEATSTTVTGSPHGKETGRSVPLLVSRHDPDRVEEAAITDDLVMGGAGLLLSGAGVWLGYTAFTSYPVTGLTWVAAAAVLIYLVAKFFGTLKPKNQRMSLAAWRRQRGADGPIDHTEIKPIEAFVSPADMARTDQIEARKSRTYAPLVAVFALALVGFGIAQSVTIARLESNGLRAAGEVVGMNAERSSGSGGYSYHAMVRYRTATGLRVEFKDKVGSNPPSHKAGDKVTVLYLASSPRDDAIVDRGMFWNWAIPALLLLGGGLLLCMAAWMFSAGRRAGSGTETPPQG